MGSAEGAFPSSLAILVIPGSCSPAPLYENLVSHIKSISGIETYVYGLPSGNRLPPEQPAGLADDASFFRDKIIELAEAGKDVVLVPHSYGGLVASDACQGVLKSQRAQQGLQGGVVRIVYLTCVVAPLDQASADVCGVLSFDWLLSMDNVSDVCPLFFRDCCVAVPFWRTLCANG